MRPDVVQKPFIPLLAQAIVGNRENVLQTCIKAPRNDAECIKNAKVGLVVILQQGMTALFTAEEWTQIQDHRFLALQLFVWLTEAQ